MLDAAWKSADEYARKKYGDGYADIKGSSRYRAVLDLYTVKNKKGVQRYLHTVIFELTLTAS